MSESYCRILEKHEVKPCPFCGGEQTYYARSFVGVYMIKCCDCGALVSFKGKEEKEDCIKAWNERVAKGIGERKEE